MPNIQVLPPHVADLIAAGEVVERPASVAKELVENAIDAGAKKITVEIQHGGMTLLRVTDDGCGIAPEQLSTAFLRHATSKLRTEYDLEAIGTLGFRGEALAAICAVSRVEVTTRVPGAALGASLRLEGGVPGTAEQAGCPEGTTMVVRDLFYNTPARLKFVKKDAAEGAAVLSAVQRQALSHPEVSVKFLRDGKQELLTPGDGRLQSAIYAVLGRELALGFTGVKGSGEGMTVSGFVSLPACCRGSRNSQHFFVNGRYVKSKLMTAAVEQAYANQRMVGKFPGCVIHLNTKLSTVDVNVHPTKTEVKFVDERQVFSAVYHAVLSALNRDTSHPAAALEKPKPCDAVTANQTAFQSMTAREYREGGLRLHDVTAPPAAPAADYRKTPPAPRRGPAAVPKSALSRAPEVRPTPPAPVRTPQPVPEPPVREARPAPEPVPVKEEARPPVQTPVPVPEELPWRLAGEVFRTYILVEQGERVLLIDKHAAHERLNFDRLKAEGYDPMMQLLLTPVSFTPAPGEREVLLENLELLERFGFQVEELGAGSLVVRQAPFDVDTEEIVPTLTALAEHLLTTGTADPDAARDALLHTMACKAAIKGGWRSGPEELERVAQAVMSGQVKYCPHGRPVAIELTKKQLEKQFRRI